MQSQAKLTTSQLFLHSFETSCDLSTALVNNSVSKIDIISRNMFDKE